MKKILNLPYLKEGFVVAVAILLAVFVSFTAAFFWSVFLAWLIWRLDSRVIAVIPLGFFVIIPLLLATGFEAPAEQLAVYAYFFLVIVVTLQIVELWRYEQRKKRRASQKNTKKTPNA